MKNFRTLNLAIAFYQDCQKLKNKLKLTGAMKDQFERASLSIPLNLSEGSAKSSAKERRKFYRTSLGSLREIQCILTLINNSDLSPQADVLGAHLFCLSRNT